MTDKEIRELAHAYADKEYRSLDDAYIVDVVHIHGYQHMEDNTRYDTEN